MFAALSILTNYYLPLNAALYGKTSEEPFERVVV
jgi:hypothetical protein